MANSLPSEMIVPSEATIQKITAEDNKQVDVEEIVRSQPPRTAYVAEAFQPKDCYTRDRLVSTTEEKTSRSPTSSGEQRTTTDDDDGLAGTNVHDEASLPPVLEEFKNPWFELIPYDILPDVANISDHDISLLHKAHHADPFAVLGPHFFRYPGEELESIVIRVWKKDASKVLIRPILNHLFSYTDEENWVEATPRADWLYQRAFFTRITSIGRAQLSPNSTISELSQFLRRAPFYYDLKVQYKGECIKEYEARDAYNFGLLMPDFDLKLFQAGSCWHVDNLMGSHVMRINGVDGVRFTVWAPTAQIVSVVGDWNQWDGRAHPMRRRVEFGVWELFVPNIGTGEKYGYRIYSKAGADFIKIDPYAQEFENPPATASIVSSCDDAYKHSKDRFQWEDHQWMKNRISLAKKKKLSRVPMSIYEVHLPSWMRGDNNTYLGYRELAHRLVHHVRTLNFTHVEFLPLAHHPFEGSWGYQVSGQYAPYSRLGNADDLKYLINELHKNNIGVFLDYVPAHFVKDSWGLVYYDGEPCYEYADPREGEHKGWGTMMYNFRRNEVRSYLLGAAYHWLRRYHIDGLRIDAVSSMIYKNHCKEPGEWLPNEFGGDANLQAITLLQELNWVIHREFPGVFTMAEESSSWQGVTDQETGLGFDAKWDLGWMNDTLAYLCTPAMSRHQKHSKLTFRGLYLGNEKWVLPLSHDEVVSGKGSLLDKCGYIGTPFNERIQTLRALYGYQIGIPGRPVLFMGSEFAQGREWKEARSLDWHESKEPLRAKVMLWVSDLLGVYRREKALHAGDDEPWNFQWLDCDNAKDNIIAWIRKYGEWTNDVVVIINFSGLQYKRYPVGVPHGKPWTVLLNSDDWRYGGGMAGPGAGVEILPTVGGRLGLPYCLWLDVPPFSCLMLKAYQLTAEERCQMKGKTKKPQFNEVSESTPPPTINNVTYDDDKAPI